MSTAIQVDNTNPSFDATAVGWSTGLLERDLLPDWLVRIGIRRLLAERLREEHRSGIEAQQAHLQGFIRQIKASPVALSTEAANQQHYEVPARFFEMVLGKRLKYSSGLWDSGCRSLDESEEAMLRTTVERAQIQNDQDILELGCGWGSLTLYMAEHFSQSKITGVSNSHSQRQFIEAQARQRNLNNVHIITADMNVFQAPERYDRIVSVEMFEHMRNYEALLERVSTWMKQDALLFVHIFTHKTYSYPFEVRDASDWMAKFFFTGGIMPGDDLLLNFQKDVTIQQHWQHSGTHYQKTSRGWLDKMDANRAEILALFADTYASNAEPGLRKREAVRWLVRWRVFFMCCEELWGFKAGEEWGVSHYVFKKRNQRYV